jgi:hypothetical protein
LNIFPYFSHFHLILFQAMQTLLDEATDSWGIKVERVEM